MEAKIDQTELKNEVKKSCDFSDLSDNVLSLKKKFLRFQSTLKNKSNSKSDKIDNSIPINSIQKQKFSRITENKSFIKTTLDFHKNTTVDSDTLIDADSSFESINLGLIKNK